MEYFENTIFHADALNLLERINTNEIKLIYLDPPWNTENEFNKSEYYEFIYKVLQQSKRILHENGFLFIYSTPSRNIIFHNLLKLTFGNQNFLTEFIIPRRSLAALSGFKERHDSLIVYSKNADSRLRNKIIARKDTDLMRLFPYNDANGRFSTQTLFSKNGINNEIWEGITPPLNNFWRYTNDKLNELKNNGLILFKENSKPVLKRYFSETDKYEAIGTIWNDLPPNIVGKIDDYFGSQSLEFLQRIILISTDENQIVLDPFCGSGTFILEAKKLNRQFIGCDNNEQAIKVAKKRFINEDKPFKLIISNALLQENIIWKDYLALSITKEDEILAKIDKGETSQVEFKESAIWNFRTHSKDSKMIEKILRSITAFLNSEQGGEIFIGVKDDKSLQDLTKDYEVADPSKMNQDGYALYLNNKIKHALGSNCIGNYEIDFYTINEKDICVINISYSKQPIFFEGQFIIRNNNQSVILNNSEFYDYIRTRQLI